MNERIRMRRERALVARIERISREQRSMYAMGGLRSSFVALGWKYTTIGRCAARYRALVGCSLADAGRTFGIAAQSVAYAESNLR